MIRMYNLKSGEVCDWYSDNMTKYIWNKCYNLTFSEFVFEAFMRVKDWEPKPEDIDEKIVIELQDKYHTILDVVEIYYFAIYHFNRMQVFAFIGRPGNKVTLLRDSNIPYTMEMYYNLRKGW